MPELITAEVDAVLTRLFKLLGVSLPRQGTVELIFHEGALRQVRPMTVITLRRHKALAPDTAEAHTQRRT